MRDFATIFTGETTCYLVHQALLQLGSALNGANSPNFEQPQMKEDTTASLNGIKGEIYF